MGNCDNPKGLQASPGQMLPAKQNTDRVIAIGMSTILHSGRHKRINKYISEIVEWGVDDIRTSRSRRLNALTLTISTPEDPHVLCVMICEHALQLWKSKVHSNMLDSVSTYQTWTQHKKPF